MSNKTEIIKELSAELYDQHETGIDDVKFILSVIGEPPKRILEVCCGSGRILVPLGKAGHNVTGLDNDQSMLHRISPKAVGMKNIRWHKADAVRDDWGTGFDVVILAGNILFNIDTGIAYQQAQELLIQKAGAALVPGGHVYIAYSPFAPNGRTLTRAGHSCDDDGSIIWSWDGSDDDGNYRKDSITKGAFDEKTGILRFKRYVEQRLSNGSVATEESESIKHYATLEQIHRWLTNAGLTIAFEYENIHKKPLNDESRNVIIYARKN